MTRLKRMAVAGLLGALAFSAGSPARADERVKMMLNWKPEGTNAPFYYALERGYYKARGLDVVLDSGEGSSAPIARIASGAYDAGFADVNTMIRYDAGATEREQVAVLMIYNRSPLVIVTLADSGIRAPRDLEGKVMGAPANDAAWQMFPALAAATGIDLAKIEVRNVAPNLRDALLARRDIAAGTGYDATSWFALKGLGLKQSDVRYLYYADYGIDLYSNGLVVSKALLERSPAAVKALVEGTTQAWMEAIRDQKPAMDALMAHEGLLNRDLETEKLQWVIARQITTPETRERGFGALDPARLQHSIGTVRDAFKLARTPTVEEVWTDRFLPPLSERKLP